ncbi:alanine racemase [Rhizohabitans arisaemae]|uniref:alanine racemase n=1 Tax=Rhizohabitans arisaemae TaxID=2720610 RepID=UPI0024B25B1C|nr:alanine racemase [Rhizohabitans arisaemae]
MGTLDWTAKGFWLPGSPVSTEEFAAAKHGLFDGPFVWPVMVARQSAIDHNIATLAAFARDQGVAFAPHGKTTMAPSLFHAQLAAGAWGLTAATASQALVMRKSGVKRIILANELLDRTALRWFAEQLDEDPGFEFLCYVDSTAGVRALADLPGTRPLRVLVELGHERGRTGCRTLAGLVETARAVDAEPRLELAGVAGYEGGLNGRVDVRVYLAQLTEAARIVAPKTPGPTVITAGGSAWFDLVAEAFAGLGPDYLPILRSGAYISHDDGFYEAKTPFNRIEGELRPALEIWAQVLSVPETGLAVAGFGKRDAPCDEGLPVPRSVRGSDGEIRPAEGLSLTRFQDHHAYLTGERGGGLLPGDLVSFGISHPCTAFDKWRFIPVVDEDHTVVDVLHTLF